MNVNLSIERLILEGLPLGPEAIPALQASLVTELARLLGEGGLAPAFGSSVAVPRLRAGDLTLEAGAAVEDPAQWGVQIARAVYGSLGAPADTTQATRHGLDE
jgi:hypothetical protein